jgi:hypothetical protein
MGDRPGDDLIFGMGGGMPWWLDDDTEWTIVSQPDNVARYYNELREQHIRPDESTTEWMIRTGLLGVHPDPEPGGDV